MIGDQPVQEAADSCGHVAFEWSRINAGVRSCLLAAVAANPEKGSQTNCPSASVPLLCRGLPTGSNVLNRRFAGPPSMPIAYARDGSASLARGNGRCCTRLDPGSPHIALRNTPHALTGLSERQGRLTQRTQRHREHREDLSCVSLCELCACVLVCALCNHLLFLAFPLRCSAPWRSFISSLATRGPELAGAQAALHPLGSLARPPLVLRASRA